MGLEEKCRLVSRKRVGGLIVAERKADSVGYSRSTRVTVEGSLNRGWVGGWIRVLSARVRTKEGGGRLGVHHADKSYVGEAARLGSGGEGRRRWGRLTTT